MKLPEPYSTVGSLLGNVGTFSANGYALRRGDSLYTEAQLKQAVRDALEAAAKAITPEKLRGKIPNMGDGLNLGQEWALEAAQATIRNMAKEIV